MRVMFTSINSSVTDGGGVRGLSSIRILKNIMSRINAKRTPDNALQPWQVFDMIGGTSTGGYVDTRFKDSGGLYYQDYQ